MALKKNTLLQQPSKNGEFRRLNPLEPMPAEGIDLKTQVTEEKEEEPVPTSATPTVAVTKDATREGKPAKTKGETKPKTPSAPSEVTFDQVLEKMRKAGGQQALPKKTHYYPGIYHEMMKKAQLQEGLYHNTYEHFIHVFDQYLRKFPFYQEMIRTYIPEKE